MRLAASFVCIVVIPTGIRFKNYIPNVVKSYEKNIYGKFICYTLNIYATFIIRLQF